MKQRIINWLSARSEFGVTPLTFGALIESFTRQQLGYSRNRKSSKVITAGRVFEVRGGWGGSFSASEEETDAYCKLAGFDPDEFKRTCLAEGLIRERQGT